jgi:glutathione synthase/RimK-type ligase-like ATP-grasp enzyme
MLGTGGVRQNPGVRARRIALCTWSDPSYVDPEPPLIARTLSERGHQADVQVWHDGEVDWSGYDLVVIRSTWDYFGRLEEFLSWVDGVASVTRIVNPSTVIRWNSHKGYLAELGDHGIPVLPSLALPRRAVGAVDQLLAAGWDDVVIKPAVDGGARLALRTRATAPEAADHLCRLVDEGDVIVQPFAPSVTLGETSLFFFGADFSHAVRKVPKAGDYRVQGHHGGSEQAHQPTGGELEVAHAAMALAPAPLAYARADFIDVDGQPTLMELELIEPDLFLRMDSRAVGRFADLVESELD